MTKTSEYPIISALVFFFHLSAGATGAGGGGATESPDTSASKTAAAGVEKAGEMADVVIFPRLLSEDLGQRINPEAFKAAAWDTNDINIYKINMSQFRDTLTFVVHDPTQGVTFTMPCNGTITSGFGARKLWGKHFHPGVDLDLETGDPVYAALDGIVRIARNNSGYGNMVVISHKGGLETLYGHMSALKVTEGQTVKSGEVIGLGGSTGHSTGSHLHFEMRVFGEQINPSQVFSFQEASIGKKIIHVDRSWFDYVNNLDIEYHVVSEGEDLETIATIYGVSVSEICDLNRISSRSALSPGMKLRYH